jgi:hypothetical protein
MDRAMLEDRFRELQSGSLPEPQVVRFQTPSGDPRPFRVSITPYTKDERLCGVRGCAAKIAKDLL